ncbi:MAG: multicopper oxidase domain-containing protein [Aliidongia sp.]
MAEYPRPGKQDQTDFYIAERKPGTELRGYEMGGQPLITTRAGSVEEWTVENWSNELHAFHMHQVHFRVLAVNGKAVSDGSLLDVVNVPYAKVVDDGAGGRKVEPGRVRIKLAFPEELAGDIPFHCHLVDHEDNGMMAVIRVLPTKLGQAGPPAGGTRSADAATDFWAHPPICVPRRARQKPNPGRFTTLQRPSAVQADTHLRLRGDTVKGSPRLRCEEADYECGRTDAVERRFHLCQSGPGQPAEEQ